MEDLNRISARLESLGELGELVGALRSVSATRSREAQDSLAGTQAYRDVVEQAIAEVMLLVPAGFDEVIPNGARSRVLLVITSENGFVGGFNARLIDHALVTRDPDEDLVIVGRRGQIAAAERGVAVSTTLSMTSRVQGITALARRIAARLSDAAGARVVFARHMAGAAYAVQTRPVLPFSAPPRAAGPMPPIIHVPPKDLLSDLASEYLFAEVAHALMESLASENGARLQTMDAASRNIADKLDALRRREHVARQEKTTTDMLDVVTGAEAVDHQ